jgi:NAD(P)-dependent dehydrogenase (short-subunit alcohol dehydrogenase family)
MAREPRSLTGKVVAITGGGRGIGRAIAQALAHEGARVAVGDLDRESAERIAAELGEPAVGLPLDVTDHAGLVAFLDEVEQRLGPLDVVVNNAGIMPVTPLADESAESIARQLDLNLRAVIHGTQEAMRRMVPRRTGHIVNISSVLGRVGLPNLATYAATKHGVVGLSEAVRAELRGTGVVVSVVMPSHVNTELTSGLADSRVKSVEPEDVAAEVVSALKKPRFDVFVPRSNGVLIDLTAPLPRTWREAFARWMKADRALLDADRSARAGYEARAAASAPAAEDERATV